jgi:drug/metabolite transporter (DMT)-like permease
VDRARRLVVRQETRPAPTKLVGLGLGFVGALLIFQPWRTSGGSSVRGELACLAAAASYGVSYVYMACYLAPRRLSAVVLACGQMIAATALLAPALVIAGRQPVDLDASVWWAMLALGPIGTGVAYIVNYAIIARDGATLASTVTYLLPVVVVALGAAVLDEPWGTWPRQNAGSRAFDATLRPAGLVVGTSTRFRSEIPHQA